VEKAIEKPVSIYNKNKTDNKTENKNIACNINADFDITEDQLKQMFEKEIQLSHINKSLVEYIAEKVLPLLVDSENGIIKYAMRDLARNVGAYQQNGTIKSDVGRQFLTDTVYSGARPPIVKIMKKFDSQENEETEDDLCHAGLEDFMDIKKSQKLINVLKQKLPRFKDS